MYKVDLRTASWTGILDNFELFDHQDKTAIAYQRFDVKENVRLSQRPTDLKIITSAIKCKQVGKPLFELLLQPEGMLVRPLKKDNNAWCVYQLVPSEKGISELKVKKGDVLKLGISTATVVQVYRTPRIHPSTTHYTKNSTLSQYQSEQTLESLRSLESSKFATADLQGLAVCRVCLGHSSSPANQIVSVCSCLGSSKFIHLKCLEIWLRDRLVVTPCKSRYVTALSKKGSRCQLCLKFYDFRALLQVKMDQFPTNYCVMQINTDSSNIYLMDFSNTSELIIGRGHQSDLSINDQTVSRRHCKILYDDIKGRFYVVDLESKFGTLLSTDSAASSEQLFRDSVILQVDRHVVYLNKVVKKGLFEKIFRFCSYQEQKESEEEQDNQEWLRER